MRTYWFLTLMIALISMLPASVQAEESNAALSLVDRAIAAMGGRTKLASVNTPSYISMDVRLGWRPNDCWEFSVVGQNLLESHHVEFAPSLVQTTPTEVNRGVYAQVVWQH